MTDTDLVLKVGDRIADKYEILAIVGRGRMGTVYKCRHEVLGKIVAIKTLHLERSNDEATRRRFEREARLASRMEHPNLISVSDFGYLANGEPYLIMDYVDGEQLAEVLKREGHLDPERAVNLFIQICDGLYHAHQREIIHRDLKPANILVLQSEGKEVAKIVDLGVAKMIQSAEDDSDAITKAGEVCGSPLYLSPEQCLYLDLDNRTDIYSLGVCLYECLVGQVPLRASSVYDTLKMHVYNMPLPFSIIAPSLDIPPCLEEVVFRCLAKATNDRYENMMQVKHELMRSRKSEFDIAPVNVLPPESLFPKPAGTSTGARTATDLPLPPRGSSGTSEQAGSGRQSRQSMSLEGVQQSSSNLDRYIQAGQTTAEMDVAGPQDFSVSGKSSGQQQAVSGRQTAQELPIAPRDASTSTAGRQTAQDMTIAARQTSEHLSAGRQTSQDLLFRGGASGPEIPVPGSPNVVQPASASITGRQTGSQILGRQTAQDMQFQQNANAQEFQQSGVDNLANDYAPYTTADPALTQNRQNHPGYASQQQIPLQEVQQGHGYNQDFATGRVPATGHYNDYAQGHVQGNAAHAQEPDFAQHAPALDHAPGRSGRPAAHHAATQSKDGSNIGKMIMIFIGACLAIGLSMGIGFATFVNKNSNTPQQGQLNVPAASNKAMIPGSTGEQNQSNSSSTGKGPSSPTIKKSGHKGSNPANGKHGTGSKAAATAHATANQNLHAAPHKAPAGHKVGQSGGTRVVKHPDGRVDVYDNETAPTYSPPPLPRSHSHSRTVSESSSGGVSIRRHADGTVDVIDTTEQRH